MPVIIFSVRGGGTMAGILSAPGFAIFYDVWVVGEDEESSLFRVANFSSNNLLLRLRLVQGLRQTVIFSRFGSYEPAFFVGVGFAFRVFSLPDNSAFRVRGGPNSISFWGSRLANLHLLVD